MRGDDAQRPEGRLDDRFERGARHAGRTGAWPRQRVVNHPADGEARGDEVAEALAAAFVAGHIDGGSEEHEVARELAPERLDLVLALAPGQIGEADVDLLQAQDVGVGDAPRLVRDARRVDDAVDAAAPLDVPGDEAHYLRCLRFKARSSGCRCSQSKAAITHLAISAADLVLLGG